MLRVTPSAAPTRRPPAHRKPKGSQRLPDDESDTHRGQKGRASRPLPNAPAQDDIVADEYLDSIDEESGSVHMHAQKAATSSEASLEALRAENEQLRAELKKAQLESTRGTKAPQLMDDMSDL